MSWLGPTWKGSVARWLPLQGLLPLSAFLPSTFNYGVSVLVLAYSGGLELRLPVHPCCGPWPGLLGDSSLSGRVAA